MAHFFTLDSDDRIKTLYISSTGEARVGLFMPVGLMEMRSAGGGRPYLHVVRGNGTAKSWTVSSNVNESWWDVTNLDEGSVIRAFQGDKPITDELPVRRYHKIPAIQSVQQRLSHRRIKIDLDSHVERILSVSDIVGEGIVFAPTDPDRLKKEIEDSGMFHHDDRTIVSGKVAALATIGEGYREISTPSLHVAISDKLCSVHIDSYAFLLHGRGGIAEITPDVGQHTLDELVFRLPAAWLRRKSPFLASILQGLHPVLPNSTNEYALRFGLRFTPGASHNLDLMRGVPRLMFESTIGPLDRKNRWQHSVELRLASGGDADRDPDWVLTAKVVAGCKDILGRGDHEKSIGLIFKGKMP